MRKIKRFGGFITETEQPSTDQEKQYHVIEAKNRYSSNLQPWFTGTEAECYTAIDIIEKENPGIILELFPLFRVSERSNILGFYAMLEKFNLDGEMSKQKIQPVFLSMAKDLVKKFMPDNGKLPVDIDIDKVEFWIAKQFKSAMVDTTTNVLNSTYEKMKNSDDDVLKKYFDEYKVALSFAKGDNKATDDITTMLLDQATKPLQANRRWSNVFDYLFSKARNVNIFKPDFVSGTLDSMDKASEEWHKKLKASGLVTQEEGEIIMEFKDGFYWIDLETNSTEDEANAMGHCGRTNADTILSLRQRKAEGSEPHVTIAIDYNEGEIEGMTSAEYGFGQVYQCKGKNNKKPIEKYHPYIVDLYIKYDIHNTGDEYMPGQDFHICDVTDPVLVNKILEHRPDLYINSGSLTKETYQMVVPVLKEKGLYQKFVESRGFVSDYYYMWEDGDLTDEQVKNKIKDVIIKDIDGKKQWFIPIKGDDITDLDFLYDDGDDSRENMSSQEFIKQYGNDLFSLFDYSHDWIDAKDVLDDITNEQVDKLLVKLVDEIDLEENQNMWDYFRDDFDGEDWFDDSEDFNSVMKRDRDALKQVIESTDDCEDFIKRVLDDAWRNATETEAYTDMLRPLEEFGIGNGELFRKYHDGDNFVIPFHIAMAKQVEPYYSLDGGNGDANLSYTRPLADILESLYNFEDFGIEADEATYKPLKINFPYNGWSNSPNKDQIQEAFDNI